MYSTSTTSSDVPDNSVDELETQEAATSRKRRNIDSGIDPSNITKAPRTRKSKE